MKPLIEFNLSFSFDHIFIEAHDISSSKDIDDTTRSKRGSKRGSQGNPKGNPKNFMLQKKKTIVGWGNITYELGY
jgi:hypothetical protein